MADLYDVARTGVALQITHGGLLGSLRRVDAARSWRDAHGLPMRPFLALKGEAPVPVGKAVEYSIPLQPTVWSLASGHRLELRLSTQADPQVCLNKLSQVEAPVLGCAPRAADLAQLAGSSYTILLTGNARSAVTVPMLRYHALPAASSSVTPTSAGVALPTQW
jgi:predicted acyl esterase